MEIDPRAWFWVAASLSGEGADRDRDLQPPNGRSAPVLPERESEVQGRDLHRERIR